MRDGFRNHPQDGQELEPPETRWLIFPADFWCQGPGPRNAFTLWEWDTKQKPPNGDPCPSCFSGVPHLPSSTREIPPIKGYLKTVCPTGPMKCSTREPEDATEDWIRWPPPRAELASRDSGCSANRSVNSVTELSAYGRVSQCP